jgi:S1-C subfamily serine protease
MDMADHRPHLRKCAANRAAWLCAIVVCAVLGASSSRGGGVQAEFPTLAPLIKRISPAIVSILSTKHTDHNPQPVDPIGGFPDAPIAETMLGSGVVLDAALGLVVTADHVVHGAETITVVLTRSSRVDARVVATSTHDDLAILKIAASGLTEIALADSSNIEVGDFVLAIGNPLGLGQSTTFGIVSALHRSVPGIENEDLLSTDALIDQGSSGGALIDAHGDLIGISVARRGRSDAGGFGFAVPANAVRPLLDQARPPS